MAVKGQNRSAPDFAFNVWDTAGVFSVAKLFKKINKRCATDAAN